MKKLGKMVNYVDLHHHIRPALVTAVQHDEETVTLTVFFPDRIDFRHGVKHDDDAGNKETNTWHWPEN